MPSNKAIAETPRSIVFRRTFDAPRTLVWRAWTSPEMIARWWGPTGCQTSVSALDLRAGGAFRLSMRTPDGETHICAAEFEEVVAPERLVYRSTATRGSPCGAGLPPRAVVTVVLRETNGRTSLTMTTVLASQSDHDAAAAAGFNEGWIATFDHLADVLAKDASGRAA